MSDDEQGRALPKEPIAWMTGKKPVGPYRMTLSTPRSEALMGAFLLGVAVLFAAQLLSAPSVPAVIVAALLVVVIGGPGAVLIVMAIARGRWARAYERLHGYRPF